LKRGRTKSVLDLVERRAQYLDSEAKDGGAHGVIRR